MQKPLLLFGLFLVPAFAVETTAPKKVLQIPVEITSKVFIEKPKENVPKEIPLKEEIGEISADKVGLLYPKEIFIPKEKVEVDPFPLSCGEPDYKKLYAEAVLDFNQGKLKEAKEKFLELLYKFPNNPYSFKAKYYLGVIAFKEGDYKKAYKLFKELCQTPLNWVWKNYSCANAVISGLWIGVKDYKCASFSTFWYNYLLWLDGKLSDREFLEKLNCEKVPYPYKGYCIYLKAFLDPYQNEAKLKGDYQNSVELRRAILSFISGRALRLTPSEISKFINDPIYGTDFEFFYIYYLLSIGDYDTALSYLPDLYAKDPQRALKLAKLVAAQGLEFAKRVLNVIPDRAIWEIYLTELYNGGFYGEVLKLAPKYGFYRLAAYAAYKLGRYKEALSYLKKLKDKNETDYRIYLDLLLRKKDWNEFLKTLKEVEKRYPNLYLEYLGWYFYYKGDWPKAAALLKEPLYKAVAYYNIGAYQKALAELRGLRSLKAKLLEARIYIALGKFEKAEKILKGIKTPEAYYLLGWVYFSQGDFKKAITYFKKCVYYYPEALLKIADSYYNLNRYEEAKKYYLRVLKSAKSRELLKDAYLGLINVYLQTQDPKLAEYIEKALKEFPDIATEEVKLKLAEALFKGKKVEEAKKLAKELLNSKNPFIKGKALLLLAKIEPQKAETYLKEALNIDIPEIKSEAVIRLVELYEREGKKGEALKFLKEHEGDITDLKKLVELYEELGAFNRLYYLLQELIPADNGYTKVAFEIAQKYNKPEFYKLALYSLDPKIATLSAYKLELYYFEKGDLKEGLKYALLLKVRNLRIEPYYTKAFFIAVIKLHKAGYLKDACELIKEINEKYLKTSEKLEIESIKVDCSKLGG